MVVSEQRCVGVDGRCRESEGKAKIEGYMSVSDEEAHQREGIRVIVELYHAVMEQGSVMLCDAVSPWLPRSWSYDLVPAISC